MATVLLVDDEPFLRATLADVLTDDGFAIVEAESGPQAARILDERADIDALVTDVRMPGAFDGLELARRAIARYPSLKVLIISGWFADEEAEIPPTARFLSKPFKFDVLTRELRGLCP